MVLVERLNQETGEWEERRAFWPSDRVPVAKQIRQAVEEELTVGHVHTRVVHSISVRGDGYRRTFWQDGHWLASPSEAR